MTADLNEAEIGELRIELAAAFRICASMNWHESVSNHFSAAVSADGKEVWKQDRTPGVVGMPHDPYWLFFTSGKPTE